MQIYEKFFNLQNCFNYFYKPVKEVSGTYYTQSQIDENNRLSNTDEYLIQGIRNLTKNDILFFLSSIGFNFTF